MDIDTVITQIRVAAPVFNQNVAGAATYANAVQGGAEVWLPQPAAYVVPLDMEGSDNMSMNELQQIVTERVGVIIDVSNTDRRGQAPATQISTFFFAICAAILNWRPDWDPTNPTENREARGFRFVSGDVLLMDRFRFQYQFVFALDITISDLDGWQLPSTPLTEITGDVTFNGGDDPVQIAVTYPAPAATTAS